MSAEWVRTCTVITGEFNELVAPTHDRIPVLFRRDAWLGEDPPSADEL